MQKKLLGFTVVLVLLVVGYFYLKPDQSDLSEDIGEATAEVEMIDSVAVVEEPKEPTVLFGYVVDSMRVIEDQVKRRQNLSEILTQYNVSYATISQIARKSRKVFDVRKIRPGKKYYVITHPDSLQTAKAFIYQPNPVDYVVYHLEDSLHVYEGKKAVDVEEKSIAGIITSSLYESMMEAGASPELANALADVFAWQIDFFRVQKHDKFKVIYEEKKVDGEVVGIGRVLGAYFQHFGEDYYGVYFDQGNGVDYFDEKGGSLRKAFLKAPLKYSRISSRYSPKRFHPVQKRWKAHLGTDYAAPRGTPIYAVGDGIVTHATYNRGNGNYVKIKHNSTYTTQYLHMSKIAKGIRQGRRVKQGQVIGYVGSTGLATGPHLCYRFWKNGRQVDALRVKIPPSEPIKKDNELAFGEVRDKVISRLVAIPYHPEKAKEEYYTINEDQAQEMTEAEQGS